METASANSARLWQLFFHCLAPTLSKPATCFITMHAWSLIDSTALFFTWFNQQNVAGSNRISFCSEIRHRINTYVHAFIGNNIRHLRSFTKALMSRNAPN